MRMRARYRRLRRDVSLYFPTHLVRTQRLALAGERDVAIGLPLEQLREHGLQVAVMVLPSQAVLLREHVER